MTGLFRRAPSLLGRVCLGLGATAAAVGCHHACKTGDCPPGKHGARGGYGGHFGYGIFPIDNCSDVPQGAIPQPIGTSTNLYYNRMAARAEQDDFVIYYNEWRFNEDGEGEAVLGPFGGEHLSRIVGRLPFVPFPVIIQPAPNDPVLTERRRQAVIDALQDAGIPDAARRVVTARPWAEGLSGDEALQVAQSRLNLNPGFGFSGTFNGFGGVSGFAGGFTGFGFGGAGFGGFGGQ